MNVGAIDQHLANILAQVVAHGANDDVGFTVDQEGSRALAGLLGNRLPDLDQVVEVPLQLFSAATDAGSAYDDAHFLRRSEEHTSELQSRGHLVCRLLLEKKKLHFTII